MSRDDNTPSPVILARFEDAIQAEVAKSTIDEMLSAADSEVAELLKRQGGVAKIEDVTEIYARYGFHNDCGWKNDCSMDSNGQDLIWEIPDGMLIEDAELLLRALGAQFVAVEPQNDNLFWPYGPHPGNYPLFADGFEFSLVKKINAGDYYEN